MTVSQLLFQIPNVSQTDPKTLIFALFFSIFWLLPWKGVALWKTAKNSHKKWFIAIFLLNTFSVLEILYIFVFAKRKKINRSGQTDPSS
jgi:methionyl-tRNA synthetase